MSTTTAIPTSSRCTSGTSAAKSTHRLDGARSRRFAAAGTACARTAADPCPRGVYAAVPDDDQREAVRRLVVAVAIGLPVLIAALVLITWLLVGRALRPVEVAARKQKDFVADAAHELRSPLAALRTQLEVAAAPG